MHPQHGLRPTWEADAYRRLRAGRKISRNRSRHLAALTRMELDILEDVAKGLDQSDREMRRARRNGIAVIHDGKYLPPLVSVSTRPLARRRGAGRPARRRVRRTRAGPDDSPGEPAPAHSRGTA